MQIPFFDLTRQHALIHKELGRAFDRVLEKGHFIDGRQVSQFESAMEVFMKGGNCISVANGTDALELAFEALDLEPGSEVIVPAFGWISGALAVYRAGLVPIFVDVDHLGLLDSIEVRRAFTPKTRAILVIHLFGAHAPIQPLLELCHEEDLILIEDCAQAIGTKVRGNQVGTESDLSIFSFYPTKNLGALGDGGCVFTRNEELAKKVRALKDYGRNGRTVFDLPGRNSRLDELQAAFLLVKLNHLEKWLERRRSIAERYLEAMRKANMAEGHSFYRFAVRSKNRAKLTQNLSEVGIGYDTLESNLMENVQYFKPLLHRNNPIARQLAAEMVCLPLFPELTDDEVSYICRFLSANSDLL